MKTKLSLFPIHFCLKRNYKPSIGDNWENSFGWEAFVEMINSFFKVGSNKKEKVEFLTRKDSSTWLFSRLLKWWKWRIMFRFQETLIILWDPLQAPVVFSWIKKEPKNIMKKRSDLEVRKFFWDQTLVVTRRFHDVWKRIYETLCKVFQKRLIINPFQPDKALL